MEEETRSAAVRPDGPVPLTVLNFFPAFTPPRSGGEMRYWHLYSRLSSLGFRVRLVNPTHPFVQPETIEHSAMLTEHRIPKTMLHHRLHQFMGRVLRQGECSAAVTAIAAARHREFVGRAREAIAESRIVIFDYPLPPQVFLPRTRPSGPRGAAAEPFVVYNAYNIEKVLLLETMRGWSGRLIAAWIGRYERALCRRADAIFACSHEDADGFASCYDIDPTKIYIIPNGVDMAAVRTVDIADAEAAHAARRRLGLDPDRPVALFLGSSHTPNLQAGEFLIRQVAPRLPNVQFVIAGSVCGGLEPPAPANVRLRWHGLPARDSWSLQSRPPANVRLRGEFEESEKHGLMQTAAVAVNPLFSGSGTNLKMLEFFAAGLPVIATPVGARGLSARDGEHVELAAPDEFADKIETLLDDPEKRRSLARAAQSLARDRFDWDRIAEDAAEILRHKTHRRVVVLNDYPVSPVTFGGKVRMYNVYRRVGREANVTILTHTADSHYYRRVLAPGVEEINIPENALKRWGKRILARLVGVAADDLMEYLTVRRCRAMRQAYLRESRFASVVVLSQPYMVPLVRGELRRRDGGDSPRSVVYDSHDVALHLKRHLYNDGLCGRWALRRVKACEREAVRRCRLVAACSDDDAQWLRRFYPAEGADEKTIVVPNGVDCSARALASPERRRALKARLGIPDEPVAVFLGSGHPPNVEAARFIVSELAPRHPDVLFVLLGGVCWPFGDMPHPRNVLLLFHLRETSKNRVLEMADVALNPLTKGSGTSIKILDYMAAGATVLTTAVGARGVAVENGVSGVICRLGQFSDALERLLNDLDACRAIGARGAEIARERYDWRVATQPFLDALRPLLEGDEREG